MYLSTATDATTVSPDAGFFDRSVVLVKFLPPSFPGEKLSYVSVERLGYVENVNPV